MAFHEVTLEKKCATQVLHEGTKSPEVSFITPANFSLTDALALDDEFEAMDFSAFEPEPRSTHVMKEVSIAETNNQDDPLSNRILRYQVTESPQGPALAAPGVKTVKSALPSDANDSDPAMACHRCGKPAPKKCSRCKSVRYCSPACQKASWKEHKKVCKRQSNKNSGSASNRDSKSAPPNTSGKLNAALKLRDKLAKILGINPKQSGTDNQTHRGSTSSSAEDFLFAGNGKPKLNTVSETENSGTDKAEFANKLRSLASGVNLPKASQIAPPSKEIHQPDPVQMAKTINLAENLSNTDKNLTRAPVKIQVATKTMDGDRSRVAPTSVTPPTPPHGVASETSSVEFQTSKLVRLNPDATRALAEQFRHEQQVSQRKFLKQMPVAAAEAAAANALPVNITASEGDNKRAAKDNASGNTRDLYSGGATSGVAAKDNAGCDGESSLEGHLSLPVDRAKLASADTLPFQSSFLKNMMFEGLEALVHQYGDSPLTHTIGSSLTTNEGNDSDTDF